MCFSKALKFVGLVFARSLMRVVAEVLARTLSLDRSLAASQGVLKVLSNKRFKCAAA